MMRLETVALELAEKLRQANPDQQKKASFLSCQLAISATKLVNENVLHVLQFLKQEKNVPSLLREKLDTLVAELDDRYFELQDKAEEYPAFVADYLHLFGQARAASALSFASHDDGSSATSEAIYEALMSVENNEVIIHAVLNLLSHV